MAYLALTLAVLVLIAMALSGLVDVKKLNKETSKLDRKVCKGCGKLVHVGRWCRDCYYEYHESKQELYGDNYVEL